MKKIDDTFHPEPGDQIEMGKCVNPMINPVFQQIHASRAMKQAGWMDEWMYDVTGQTNKDTALKY